MKTRFAVLAGIAVLATGFAYGPAWLPQPVSTASAQVAAMTVGAVASGLSSALDGLRAAIGQAGDEFRSVGNSLQANAQNVLQDLNKVLKDRMNQTLSGLDAQERRLAEDAEALTRQIQTATAALISRSGEEARRTIADADIAAYNASYSLPCRDQRPRVVAAFPGEIIVAQSAALITLRGNFLNQGQGATATVGERPARIVERLATSIRIEIPDDIAPIDLSAPRTVSVVVSGLQTKDRTLWFGLACRERDAAEPPVTVALTVRPQITYSVAGSLRTRHMIEEERTEAVQRFSRTGSDICDDNFDVTQPWCTPDENAVRTTAAVSVTSANCGSAVQGWSPSGPRCVVVRGRVQGCGANRTLFNAWVGCKGRGWLNYDVALTVTTRSRVTAGESRVDVQPSVAQRSWSWPFPAGQIEPTYEYEIVVVRRQGTVELDRWAITGANPNSGPIRSRIADGALAVELSE